MNIENIAIADGQIQSITSNSLNLSLVFLDYKEQLWNFEFNNIVAVENFNIETEVLTDLTIESDNELITMAMKMTEEDNIPVLLYSFFSNFKDKAGLRIVAGNCKVEQILP